MPAIATFRDPYGAGYKEPILTGSSSPAARKNLDSIVAGGGERFGSACQTQITLFVKCGFALPRALMNSPSFCSLN